jgi:hypothetical protein
MIPYFTSLRKALRHILAATSLWQCSPCEACQPERKSNAYAPRQAQNMTERLFGERQIIFFAVDIVDGICKTSGATDAIFGTRLIMNISIDGNQFTKNLCDICSLNKYATLFLFAIF